jgi:ribokinase
MRMTLPALLVVGSINQDLTARAARLPGPGETIGDARLTVGAGGKGANQAVAAARLGAHVSMIGAVGDDAAGRDLLTALAAAGVDTAGIAVGSEATGTALIVVDEAGENQIVVCPGANGEVAPDTATVAAAPVVLAQLETGVGAVEIVARAATGFLAVNAAPALLLPADVLVRADLVIVNESEASALPGLAAARRVAVTYGEAGSALFEGGREVARVRAVATEVVSTVGAGDAYCAALTLGLASGLAAEVALRVAAEVAADAVKSPASQPPLEPWAHYVGRAGAC